MLPGAVSAEGFDLPPSMKANPSATTHREKTGRQLCVKESLRQITPKLFSVIDICKKNQESVKIRACSIDGIKSRKSGL